MFTTIWLLFIVVCDHNGVTVADESLTSLSNAVVEMLKRNSLMEYTGENGLYYFLSFA